MIKRSQNAVRLDFLTDNIDIDKKHSSTNPTSLLPALYSHLQKYNKSIAVIGTAYCLTKFLHVRDEANLGRCRHDGEDWELFSLLVCKSFKTLY